MDERERRRYDERRIKVRRERKRWWGELGPTVREGKSFSLFPFSRADSKFIGRSRGVLAMQGLPGRQERSRSVTMVNTDAVVTERTLLYKMSVRITCMAFCSRWYFHGIKSNHSIAQEPCLSNDTTTFGVGLQ